MSLVNGATKYRSPGVLFDQGNKKAEPKPCLFIKQAEQCKTTEFFSAEKTSFLLLKLFLSDNSHIKKFFVFFKQFYSICFYSSCFVNLST